MVAYYNEYDPFAAQWLKNLIKAGVIPDGDVDERSIVDVKGDYIRGYDQYHFFAGISGWSHALRLVGWPDDRMIVTGSCPCQPFSNAGQRKGSADERHLWPEFRRLIEELSPPVVIGEQVASKLGREWLAGIRADLEDLGYAVGAADLCAASAGAPHIRQRLFWVAQSTIERRSEESWGAGSAYRRAASESRRLCDVGGLAHTSGSGSGRNARAVPGAQAQGDREGRQSRGLVDESVTDGAAGGLANANYEGRTRWTGGQQNRSNWDEPSDGSELGNANPDRCGATWRSVIDTKECNAQSHGRMGDAASEQMGRAGQPWQDSVWLPCLDGKARRIESGSFPLSVRLSKDMGSDRPGEASAFRIIRNPKTGESIGQAPWRVGMLRGYGNAIVPPLAAEFIKAFLEAIEQ